MRIIRSKIFKGIGDLDYKDFLKIYNYCTKEPYLFMTIDTRPTATIKKYEFLTRKDLKYKPNALDKARFEFSPLRKTFSTGLDRTSQGYQEEGVIKLLKDIRDNLVGGNRPNDNDDNDDNEIPSLETEEEAEKRTEDFYEQKKDNYDDIIKNLKGKIFNLETKLKDSELSNEEKDKLNNEEKDKIYKMLNKFKDNMKENIDNFDKKIK